MAKAYRTNGPALVTVDGSELGLSSVDGVSIKVNQHREEVFSDQRGSAIPSEIIGLGTDATISFELWNYDDTVLSAFLQKRAGAGTAGTSGTIGELMIAGGRMSTVVVASPVDGHAWTFNRAFAADDVEFSLNTSNVNKVNMTIRCIPDGTGTTGVVYTRT